MLSLNSRRDVIDSHRARRLQLAYAGTFAALAAVYVALTNPPRLLWATMGLGSVIAMLIGIRANGPRLHAPWYLLAAGTAAFISGDMTYDLLTHVLGYDNPFPSIADVLYLLSYPLFAAGLLLMVRARSVGSDWAALCDALIVTIGLGLLTWFFLVRPYVQNDSLSALERVVSIGYPMGDVLLLAVLTRLLVGAGARSPALHLLTGGAVGLLASDVAYGLEQLNGSWQTGGLVDVGWIVFYGTWGAAALQSDMADLAEPVRCKAAALSRGRLALLAVVSLIAPALILLQTAARSSADLAVIAVASGAMFLLVTARLDGLIQLARRSTQRERVLRRTGERLVAASSREEIHRAVAEAVLEVAGDGARGRVLLALDDGSGARWVHDSAPCSGLVASDASPFLEQHADKLRQHHFVFTDSDRTPVALGPAIGPGVPLLAAALTRDDAVAGALVLAGADVPRAGVVDAICALATQAALALESAALTEQVLRRRNEAHFRSLIQNASDVILVVDADLRIVYQTPSVHAVLGIPAEEVDGRPVTDLVAAEDAPHAALLLVRARATTHADRATDPLAAEWRVRHPDGRLRTVEVTCRNLLNDESVKGLVLTLHDITDRRALEEELKILAFHDALTMLPNRALFADRVEHALRRQRPHRERLAVMLIDLDDFKMINDTRGHAAGDALLVAVADRLRGCLRGDDTATRLGGDEFAVFAEGLLDDQEAAHLADRILEALRPPYRLGGEELTVRASVGVATSEHGADAAELLRQADLAMYAAKDAGRGGHAFFNVSMLHRLEGRLEWRRDLERGLRRHGEFALHYQPVCELETGSIVGAEGLLRWHHPARGLVLPGEFIDVVEQSDLASALGAWVLEEAVAAAARCERSLPFTRLHISVNVAPRQLTDANLIAVVTRALARHQVAPHALTLEVTERTLAGEDDRILGVMRDLHDLGVRLALDDFGTGYSALGYLRRFPVSSLKIDRSFVSGVDRSPDDRALVEAIVRLGETFGLGLVAEGIETPGQRDALLALGCERGQGFLYSRPVAESELTALLDAQRVLEMPPAPAEYAGLAREERSA